MQGAPLTQDFSKGTRIDNFIHRHTRAFIGGDVADAIATGLNAVHVHRGQQVHHIRAFLQRDPVVLQVLPRGEVGIAIAQRRCGNATNRVLLGLRRLKQGFIRTVKFTGNPGQDTQLGAVEFAIRHSHAQHGRIALQIPAVLQTQRAKFFLAELAIQTAGQLVAVLGGTLLHKAAVKVGVLVHITLR